MNNLFATKTRRHEVNKSLNHKIGMDCFYIVWVFNNTVIQLAPQLKSSFRQSLAECSFVALRRVIVVNSFEFIYYKRVFKQIFRKL